MIYMQLSFVYRLLLLSIMDWSLAVIHINYQMTLCQRLFPISAFYVVNWLSFINHIYILLVNYVNCANHIFIILTSKFLFKLLVQRLLLQTNMKINSCFYKIHQVILFIFFFSPLVYTFWPSCNLMRKTTMIHSVIINIFKTRFIF